MDMTRYDINTHHAPESKSKRIASNTIVLFVRMLFITLINLYTVRWVLKGLGTEDYGIFNAVAGVVAMSTCVSSILSLSTQRFYSYAIGQNNIKNLRDIFSVSLNCALLLSAILIVLSESIGIWLFDTQLTIPTEKLSTAKAVFHFSVLSFLFSIIQIPFMGAVFAHEQMKIYALVSMGDCLLKLLTAFMIGKVWRDNLFFYGLCLCAIAFIVMSSYIIVAKKNYPECRYKKVTDLKLYKDLAAFSGWTFYGALSGVSMIQGGAILLNIFFGPLINAAYSISNQIYNAFNALSNSIVIAFRPAMIKAYSRQDQLFLGQLFSASNKFLLYLLICVSIPFIIETDSILNIWLEQPTRNMILFSRLYIIYTIFMAMHNPISTLMQATGNIRNYSLCVETINLLSVPITWVLFKIGLPSFYIFVSMICTCILAHCIRLFFLRNEFMQFTISSYMKTLIAPSVAIIIVSMAITYTLHSQLEDAAIRLFTIFTVSPIVTIALTYLIGTTRHERHSLNRLVKQRLRKG